MQTIRVVLAAIFLGLFGLARPFGNCSALDGERRQAMPYRISTLLLRNRISAIYLFFDKLP